MILFALLKQKLAASFHKFMLTKTNFMHFVECPVYLWLSKHRPDLLPEATPETRRILEMGREVDLLSRRLFPGGVEVGGFNAEGWKNTKKLMAGSAKILFQPTAVASPLTCRADIFTRNNKIGGWDMHEVKMATEVKDEYYWDVAFQKICFEDAGVPIGRANLIHINNKYVRRGEIDEKKLFISEDITDEVCAKILEVRAAIKEALRIMNQRSSPDAALLASCPRPKYCEYLEYYCRGIKNVHSVARELPAKFLLTLLERKFMDASRLLPEVLEKTGYKPEADFVKIDAPAIRRELGALEYPLYFFDYETYSAAIPSFDGTRPYQQIPFQYSLLVKDAPGAKIRAFEFLAREFKNPAPELLAQLKREIGTRGSIIAWNARFEKGRNDEMARMMPEYAGFLKSINARIYDLMLIFKFKNQWYVRSEFQKSASLKKVLPVLCPELSYESLVIKEGGAAAAGWPVLTGTGITAKEKARLSADMLAYCKRDTEAMVGILERVVRETKMKIVEII